MTSVDELLGAIFDSKQPELYSEFESWVRGSRRFKAFATSYRSKLRTKLRNAIDENRMKDVRAELETAALLLRDERFTLEYEKYAASKQRGPDFTVTFRTHTPFNVEVRRMHSGELEIGDADAPTVKLIAVLCDKVGQMPPGIVNLLWLIPERGISLSDLIHTTMTLQLLAERKMEDYFTRRGFESAADFLKQYRQLSGIVLHMPGENAVWMNALARHKTPSEIVVALTRLETK